jgi:hypothetical protein
VQALEEQTRQYGFWYIMNKSVCLLGERTGKRTETQLRGLGRRELADLHMSLFSLGENRRERSKVRKLTGTNEQVTT